MFIWIKKSTSIKVEDGIVATHFFPSGRAEPNEFKIQDNKGYAFLIKINPPRARYEDVTLNVVEQMNFKIISRV